MPGTLHVISTPIGNLEDITLRALRLLREVALIAAEDTRHTSKLLHHYGIVASMLSYHEHNRQQRLPVLIERLQQGSEIALVTDAGTPGISDPGVELVDACVNAGIPVNPVPGPSALLAAVVASGFPLAPLTWLGFGPRRGKDLYDWLQRIRGIPHTVCFLESPHRIEQTINALADILGERQISLARELTKAHQEVHRGFARDVFGQMHSIRGEFTVVVGPSLPIKKSKPVTTEADIVRDFGQLAEAGGFSSRRALVTELAKRHGRSSREIYALILEHLPEPE
jgi:16S rRNA (cytidine1402-2'-O)-methyltransferase